MLKYELPTILPHTSKWNPIEHRLFPHITRSLQGMVLTSHELAKELIGTTTKAGLKVFTSIIKCFGKTKFLIVFFDFL